MLSLLFIYGSVGALLATECEYKNGSFSVKWTVEERVISMEMSDTELTVDQWAGVVFASSMDDLEGVVMSVITDKNERILGHRNEEFIIKSTNDHEKFLHLSTQATVYMRPSRPVATTPGYRAITFDRPWGRHGKWDTDLNNCMEWKFYNHTPLINGKPSLQNATSISKIVCPRTCNVSEFDEREMARLRNSNWRPFDHIISLISFMILFILCR